MQTNFIFHIDTSKIVAAGGSAGGHLAAATALIDDYNENTDNMSVSCIPNALVLINPVIDNGPGGYGYDRIGDAYKSFSPLHNIKNGTPPTIIFLGTNDNLIPVETAKYYQKVARCASKGRLGFWLTMPSLLFLIKFVYLYLVFMSVSNFYKRN